MKERLTNATHVLVNETLEIFGLKIYGLGWNAWEVAGQPDRIYDVVWKASQRYQSGGQSDVYSDLPDGIDILMTHCPPS